MINLEQMLESSVHLGHPIRQWSALLKESA